MSLRNSILGRRKNKPLTDEDFIQVHHDFMMCYGWISVEEFKKTPPATIFNLMQLVQKEKVKREKWMIYVLRGQGFKKVTSLDKL